MCYLSRPTYLTNIKSAPGTVADFEEQMAELSPVRRGYSKVIYCSWMCDHLPLGIALC